MGLETLARPPPRAAEKSSAVYMEELSVTAPFPRRLSMREWIASNSDVVTVELREKGFCYGPFHSNRKSKESFFLKKTIKNHGKFIIVGVKCIVSSNPNDKTRSDIVKEEILHIGKANE